jgi:hypothetical protein
MRSDDGQAGRAGYLSCAGPSIVKGPDSASAVKPSTKES